MRLLLRVPLVWCLSTLALAFASVAEAQTKILCGLTTAPGPGIAYLYFGKELGFDRQEGIDLEFVVLPGTPAVYQQLAAGRIQIGLPQPDPLVKALAKGERLPIRFIFNVIRRSESEMVVLDASQYRNIKDLKGQSIGVGGMGWGNVPKTRALLRQAGLVDGKDFTLTAVGDGAPAFKALMDGQVAALNLNDSRHADGIRGASQQRSGHQRVVPALAAGSARQDDAGIRQVARGLRGEPRGLRQGVLEGQPREKGPERP